MKDFFDTSEETKDRIGIVFSIAGLALMAVFVFYLIDFFIENWY